MPERNVSSTCSRRTEEADLLAVIEALELMDLAPRVREEPISDLSLIMVDEDITEEVE
jgi:hypothetical protein